MKTSIFLLAVCLALGVSTGSHPARRQVKDENLDSLSRSFQAMTRDFTTPEFERRKQALRQLQRSGYVEVLSDVVADDGVSAFISLLRVNARIAYHLPHEQLVFHLPPAEIPSTTSRSPWHFLAPASAPYAVPLVQDWTFPEDPWSDR